MAVEVRQSNRIAIAATEISIRAQFSTINEQVLENDGVAELLAKAAQDESAFSSEETEKLYAFMYLLINTWIGIEVAYDNGMLPRTTFDEALDDIGVNFRDYPALRPIAREHLTLYPSKADSEVYKVMKKHLSDTD